MAKASKPATSSDAAPGPDNAAQPTEPAAAQAGTADDAPLQPSEVVAVTPNQPDKPLARGHVRILDIAAGVEFDIHESALQTQQHLTDSSKFAIKKKAS